MGKGRLFLFGVFRGIGLALYYTFSCYCCRKHEPYSVPLFKQGQTDFKEKFGTYVKAHEETKIEVKAWKIRIIYKKLNIFCWLYIWS